MALSPVHAPSKLPVLVRAAFDRARASGDLNFYPTLVAVLRVNAIPFQLRFCPSLAHKPQHPRSSDSDATTTTTTTTTTNPFLHPSPALLIAPLPPSHTLLLNRFAIVPHHFLLITSTFHPQTDLLTPADLAAALAVQAAYEDQTAGGELFVFFNSGAHSGASQPHRHLQLLPVASMRAGLDEPDGGGWDVLAATLLDGAQAGGAAVRPGLPFATFAAPVARRVGAEEAHALYLGLYRRACEAVGVRGAAGQEAGEARISYNLALARGAMVLCPRLAEGAAVVGEGGEEVGLLALNGTVLAGTALVKSQKEWDALTADPEQLGRILGKIGLPAAGVDS